MTIGRNIIAAGLTILALCFSAQAGEISPDSLYRRADMYGELFGSKYYNAVQESGTIDDTGMFWYKTRTPRGTEYYILDADHGRYGHAFDHVKLAAAISSETGGEVEPYALPVWGVNFTEEGRRMAFNTEGGEYLADLTDYTLQKQERRDDRDRRRGGVYWSSVFLEDARNPVPSPDGKYEAYISEGNLWVRELESGHARPLSRDGSPGEYYSSNIYWSPDSRMIVCCKYRPADVRRLTLISSSPRDGLQPVMEEWDYIKPGDALPVRRPVLFDVENGTAKAVEFAGMDNQFDLGQIRWRDDSNGFTFDLNERGHQRYRVFGMDAADGSLRTIVDETSPTFIHYYGLHKHWLDATDELLWLSERDGWKHLYLVDQRTGRVKRQLTRGEWVVKRVVKVDDQERRIVYVGCGMDKGEDPYLEKFYSLDIDTGEITCLTPENGNHKVKYSADGRYILDIYSRVDLPPTCVVRSATDGTVLIAAENQPDITAAAEAGWRMPEVFSAKGRDGQTDIWGVIIRPTDFDPAKKYPVVEYIYAGPHDSHVPKDFHIEHRCSALSELGFITVMIDGMGTANRGKAFHDVCWQNLKDAGFPDRIAWMKAAAERYPEMDLDRVGIYGGSAGGQNAMGALLFHPDFYKVGVAACGCHDNRMDKIWWNEQWMGYPIGTHYEESSNVVNAGKLEGKLMLILGELDNNVDPASTLQVVDALIKEGKEFEFVMLPGARHTLGESYGERKRRDFFMRHLTGGETPEWNN